MKTTKTQNICPAIVWWAQVNHGKIWKSRSDKTIAKDSIKDKYPLQKAIQHRVRHKDIEYNKKRFESSRIWHRHQNRKEPVKTYQLSEKWTSNFLHVGQWKLQHDDQWTLLHDGQRITLMPKMAVIMWLTCGGLHRVIDLLKHKWNCQKDPLTIKLGLVLLKR